MGAGWGVLETPDWDVNAGAGTESIYPHTHWIKLKIIIDSFMNIKVK